MHLSPKSQSIKGRRDEENIIKKTNITYMYETTDEQIKKNCNRGAAIGWSAGKQLGA